MKWLGNFIFSLEISSKEVSRAHSLQSSWSNDSLPPFAAWTLKSVFIQRCSKTSPGIPYMYYARKCFSINLVHRWSSVSKHGGINSRQQTFVRKKKQLTVHSLLYVGNNSTGCPKFCIQDCTGQQKTSAPKLIYSTFGNELMLLSVNSLCSLSQMNAVYKNWLF